VYTYHGATDVVATKIGYSVANYADPKNPIFDKIMAKYEFDTNGVLTVKYTYYYNTSRMESKTLASKDQYDNVYYHYVDEDWNSQGFGRVDKQVLDAVDGAGAIAYYYEYHTGTAVVKKKVCYKTADYSNPKDPQFDQILIIYEFDTNSNLTVKYTHYDDAANLLESQTLQSKDQFDNLYYHYINEDWNSQGYGRVDKQVLDAVDGDGAIAYYYEYHTGTNVIKKKIGYTNGDYSDPKNPVFTTPVIMYEYDTNGNWTIKSTFYTDTGYLESKTLKNKDAFGNFYYHYINEDWNSQGYGRVDKLIFDGPDGDSAYGYVYVYYAGTNVVKEKLCYNLADYADPKNPTFDKLMAKYEYDSNGNQTVRYTYYYDSSLMESKTLATADTDHNVYFHHMNENFNGQGYGRVDKQIRDTADSDGALGYYYEYHTGTDTIKKKICYKNAEYSDVGNPQLDRILIIYEFDTSSSMTVKYTYYDDASNLIQSQTRPSADTWGNLYYHYINEDFQSQGYGRVDKQVSGSVDGDGATAYRYEYYAGSYQAHYKYCYQTANYSDPANPILINLLVRYEFNTSGQIIGKIVYGGGSSAMLARPSTQKPAEDETQKDEEEETVQVYNEETVLLESVRQTDNKGFRFIGRPAGGAFNTIE